LATNVLLFKKGLLQASDIGYYTYDGVAVYDITSLALQDHWFRVRLRKHAYPKSFVL